MERAMLLGRSRVEVAVNLLLLVAIVLLIGTLAYPRL